MNKLNVITLLEEYLIERGNEIIYKDNSNIIISKLNYSAHGDIRLRLDANNLILSYWLLNNIFYLDFADPNFFDQLDLSIKKLEKIYHE